MIEVYIPIGAGKATHVAQAFEAITRAAGGVTVFSAVGGWFTDGKQVVEHVEVARWFGEGLDLQPLIEAMWNAGEESVLVVVDGKERFYKAGEGVEAGVSKVSEAGAGVSVSEAAEGGGV